MHVGNNRPVQSFPNPDRSAKDRPLKAAGPKTAAIPELNKPKATEQKKEEASSLQPPDGATDGLKRLAEASDTLSHRAMRSAGRAVARVLLPVGLALDGADVLKGYQADRARADGKKTKTWAAVGAAAGGYAGEGLGAAAGVAIGTMIFPGPGTLIGGALGAFLGGWVGSGAGSDAAEAATH